VRVSSFFVLGLGLLSALACSLGAPCGEGTTKVDGECVADTPEVVDTAPPETDPSFLSFSSDVDTVTEDGVVYFTAVLTDPQGTGDIVGGTLTAPGGSEYGTFTDASGGRYTMNVTWAQFHTMNSIDFDEAGEDREVVAHFTDTTGTEVTASLTIHLYCDAGVACSGSCVDLDTDAANCGTCGNVCGGECQSGGCYEDECVPLTSSLTTCDQACASVGATCGGDVCSGGTITGYAVADTDTCDGATSYRILDECSTPFPSGYDQFAECCCVE
jgi:hypothetical protein